MEAQGGKDVKNTKEWSKIRSLKLSENTLM